MDKFYITTPIYYVNDKPHIGTAYTTIAADVLSRFYRDRGADTFFLTGTAEHGSKIAGSAEKAGMEVQKFVDEQSAKFAQTWANLNVNPDDFIRTTQLRHSEAVQLFFNKLKESGKIYEGEYEGLYCVGHEAYLKEAELVDGVCPEHKTKPEYLAEQNWFFKLSAYAEILIEKITSGELIILPEERKNEILAFIKQGLEDIAISRQNAKFALPLPWDNQQTIYVWLDELFNYCSAVGYGVDDERFKKFWPADVHLVGKDIIKFHCIIWPALLLAIGERVPKKVFAHGFFTVDGQKMSKTIGNVIDPNQWVDKYGSDTVRYFLLREVPFGQDGDVSEDKLQARYDGELANGLGNLVSRVTTLIEQYAVLPLPPPSEPLFSKTSVDQLIEEFRFHEALAKIWEQIAWANKTVDENKLWVLGKNNDSQFMQLCSDIVFVILLVADEIKPFMPKTSQKIISHFSQSKIVKIEPLFPKK